MGLWLTFTLTHMLLTLAVAGLMGWLADLVVPGELPYSWLGAVAAGLIGGWLAALLMGNVGPNLFGVYLLPAFVGATALAVAVELVGKSTTKQRSED
ncbi:MAG: GlsB/YeaQ/YmgE family stress response membrane protein [Chloroflexi bacterium]|nr:GlsB/YeaQ/YmgE family stress response membrane protein [Chloroflexota bacterium]